ncbi:MAG: Biopolymer transport protein ExbB [Chlamydiae bacterium]|nr:Biopolymer transport protein ExbB [Chlamydiota bacterium]
MFIKNFYLLSVSSSFYQAYIHSDFLGKFIFLALIATSVCCWTILVHKIWLTNRVRKNSKAFYTAFKKRKGSPLHLENEGFFRKQTLNPFFELFLVLKKQTKDILNKNQQFGIEQEGVSYLSSSDVDCIESQLISNIASQTIHLEKNLFILSTIVGLAPLLGLMGTVWGILTTFSEMQTQAISSTNQMVLGGISLALTTTVLGLLNAIPALIAYNYLKNSSRDFATEMEGFANEILSSVEMQYRKVDLHR